MGRELDWSILSSIVAGIFEWILQDFTVFKKSTAFFLKPASVLAFLTVQKVLKNVVQIYPKGSLARNKIHINHFEYGNKAVFQCGKSSVQQRRICSAGLNWHHSIKGAN